MRGDVTDAGRTNEQQQLKIELLSQWKLEAESRKNRGGLAKSKIQAEEFMLANVRISILPASASSSSCVTLNAEELCWPMSTLASSSHNWEDKGMPGQWPLPTKWIIN